MTRDFHPPRFTSHNYEPYRLELQAWSVVNILSKMLVWQNMEVLYLCHYQSITNIKSEKVFSALSLDDLTKEDNLNILIKFLDAYLGNRSASR